MYASGAGVYVTSVQQNVISQEINNDNNNQIVMSFLLYLIYDIYVCKDFIITTSM